MASSASAIWSRIVATSATARATLARASNRRAAYSSNSFRRVACSIEMLPWFWSKIGRSTVAPMPVVCTLVVSLPWCTLSTILGNCVSVAARTVCSWLSYPCRRATRSSRRSSIPSRRCDASGSPIHVARTSPRSVSVASDGIPIACLTASSWCRRSCRRASRSAWALRAALSAAARSSSVFWWASTARRTRLRSSVSRRSISSAVCSCAWRERRS